MYIVYKDDKDVILVKESIPDVGSIKHSKLFCNYMCYFNDLNDISEVIIPASNMYDITSVKYYIEYCRMNFTTPISNFSSMCSLFCLCQYLDDDIYLQMLIHQLVIGYGNDCDYIIDELGYDLKQEIYSYLPIFLTPDEYCNDVKRDSKYKVCTDFYSCKVISYDSDKKEDVLAFNYNLFTSCNGKIFVDTWQFPSRFYVNNHLDFHHYYYYTWLENIFNSFKHYDNLNYDYFNHVPLLTMKMLTNGKFMLSSTDNLSANNSDDWDIIIEGVTTNNNNYPTNNYNNNIKITTVQVNTETMWYELSRDRMKFLPCIVHRVFDDGNSVSIYYNTNKHFVASCDTPSVNNLSYFSPFVFSPTNEESGKFYGIVNVRCNSLQSSYKIITRIECCSLKDQILTYQSINQVEQYLKLCSKYVISIPPWESEINYKLLL